MRVGGRWCGLVGREWRMEVIVRGEGCGMWETWKSWEEVEIFGCGDVEKWIDSCHGIWTGC